MKAKLAGIMTAIMLLVSALVSAEVIYPETMVITHLDYANDMVICETANGHEFAFCGIEDYQQGELVSCIMYSGFTPEIFDDEFLATYYSGWSFENVSAIIR